MIKFSPVLLLMVSLGCSETNPGDTLQAASNLATPPVPLGVYHLPNSRDATSLELKADGTFRWVTHGCDSGGGDQGEWTVEKDRLLLRPREDATELQWPGEFALNSVSSVELRGAPSGDQGIVAGVVDEGRSGDQGWLSGGACAICGGGRGPTGQRECENPFEGAKDNL
jgi:hypothetical protein